MGRLRVRLLSEEIAKAADPTRGILAAEAAKLRLTLLAVTDEAIGLAKAYVAAGALPGSASVDALHVGVASVHRVDAVVSWNFRHMVSLRRRRMVHAVNLQLGYPLVDIVSPMEVFDA